MLHSTEYTTLNSGREPVITIKPNVEFKPFTCDNLTVTSYCRIMDKDSKTVQILKPGEIVSQVGEVSKLKDIAKSIDLTVKELKESLRTAGISFPSKATRSKLIELLRG